RGGQRVAQLPRTHARDVARHRPTREARGVPTAARRVPPRIVERPRRLRTRARRVGGRASARTGAGRRWREPRRPCVLPRTARAVLQVMQSIDAPALAEARGASIIKKLQSLPGVTGVRGLGLLLGVELEAGVLQGRLAKDVAAQCLDAGLVLNGITNTALRLA